MARRGGCLDGSPPRCAVARAKPQAALLTDRYGRPEAEGLRNLAGERFFLGYRSNREAPRPPGGSRSRNPYGFS